MANICEEIKRKLVGQNGILSVEASKDFIDSLENSLNDIVKKLEDTPEGIEKKLTLSTEEYQAWVKEQADKVIDMDSIKEGMRIAMHNQIKAHRALELDKAAIPKITSKVVNAVNQFLELEIGKTPEQLAKMRGTNYYDGIISKVNDVIIGGIATKKLDIVKDFIKDSQIIVQRSGKEFMLDLDGITSVPKGIQDLENYLFTRNVLETGLEKETAQILTGLHTGIKRLDDTVKKQFGINASFDGVYNHKLLQDTVLGIKRNFLNKRATVKEKIIKFLLDSNSSKAGAKYIDSWKNYLENWIGENLLDADILALRNSKEIKDTVKYQSIVEKVAINLDNDLSAVLKTTNEIDKELGDIISLTTSFSKYSNFIRKDFKDIAKIANTDFIDVLNDTIDIISTRMSTADILGNNPVANLDKVKKNLNNKFKSNSVPGKILGNEIPNLEKSIKVIVRNNNFDSKNLGIKSLKAISRLSYAKTMFGILAVQISDISSMMAKASSKTNENILKNTFKLGVGYTKDLLTEASEMALKKSGISDKTLKSLSDIDRKNLVLKTSYYIDSMSSNGNFKIAKSKTDSSWILSATREFEKNGITGAHLEVAKNLGLIELHAQSVRRITNTFLDGVYENFTKFSELSQESKAIINGSGFSKESYDLISDLILSKRDHAGIVDTFSEHGSKQIIEKMSIDETLNFYKEFAKNDYATVLQVAEKRARVINPFLEKGADAEFGALNKDGINKLFKYLKDYEVEKGYKSWVQNEILKNKIIEISKFPTVIGSDLRVVIDPDNFRKLISEEGMDDFVLDATGYTKKDLDIAIMSLYDNVNMTINYGYKQAVLKESEKFIKKVEYSMMKKDFENQKIIDDLFKYEFSRIEGNEVYAKSVVDGFKQELNFRIDNIKAYASEQSAGQSDTLYKASLKNIDDASPLTQVANITMTHLKATMIRNTASILETFKFNALDIMENGNKAKMRAITKYSSLFAASMFFGGIALMVEDSLNLEWLEDYKKPTGEIDAVKFSLAALESGTFVGSPISERNLMYQEIKNLYFPITSSVETLVTGKDAYWKSTNETLDFSQRLDYSTKALLYGIYRLETNSRARDVFENKYMLDKIEEDSFREYIKNNLE